MLPTHRPPPRSSKRSFLPRSRLTLFLALFLGSFALYSLYSLAGPEYYWPPHPGPDGPHHPPPPHWDNGHLPNPHKAGPETEKQFSEEQLVWRARAASVKESFLHAWNSYEKHAWGFDEVRPLSESPVQNFNGWGVSIVDSLDTLLIMDLRPQFARAMDHVASMNFTQSTYDAAPFFETIIRYLGGLLSAYALVVDEGATSGISWEPTQFSYEELHVKTEVAHGKRDPTRFNKGRMPNTKHLERARVANILLTRADHLARALLPAFNTTSSLPVGSVNTVTGVQRNAWSSLLAEIGSCQMEYKYLAHITGRREYFDAVNNVTNILETIQQKSLKNPASQLGGMFPTHYTVTTGEGTDNFISVGSLADSAYEYLLKGYLLSGRSEHRLLDMYLHSSHTALRNLTYLSPVRDLLYVTDAHGGWPSHRLEHLSCFFPGLLALGVENLNSKSTMDGKPIKVELPETTRERHFWAAEGIAETCWLLYADNPMGLGSEEVNFDRPKIPSTSTDGAKQPTSVASGPTHNRWWDIVDDWERSGRKTSKPRGIHGTMTKPVVTNGGKGSWELYGASGLPAENERPIPASVKESIEQSKSLFSTNAERTHLRDYGVKDDRWLMRPETIESLYLMFRLTRDSIWRERCYSIYQGMEKFARAKTGYASVRGVNYDIDEGTKVPKYSPTENVPGEKQQNWNGWNLLEDSMPSYALAETFKYMYLCLLDPDESAALLPSDKWIFNTEAHPLPVFQWTELERKEWDIR